MDAVVMTLRAERDFYKALAEPRTEMAEAEVEGGRS